MSEAMQHANEVCLVLYNGEGEYLIWPKQREIPAGWRFVGKEGIQKDCLSYLDELWSNMEALTLSVRIGGEMLS